MPSVEEVIAVIKKHDQALERFNDARTNACLAYGGMRRLGQSMQQADLALGEAGAVYDAACEELAEMICRVSAESR